MWGREKGNVCDKVLCLSMIPRLSSVLLMN